MRKIPKALIREMVASPFYRKCCVTGKGNYKIDFHHNFIYAGRQVNRRWCILPLTKKVHDNIVKYKDRCDWIMLNRAPLRDLLEFSKGGSLIAKKNRLNKKYGEWTADWYAKIDNNEAHHD